MGGTDALTKKDFWMELEWSASQLRHSAVIFEGMRWGRMDIPDALPMLESFCSRRGYELWLGWMDAPVTECFRRVNGRKCSYRISLPGLTVQREKIYKTAAVFPRVMMIKDISSVNEWLSMNPQY